MRWLVRALCVGSRCCQRDRQSSPEGASSPPGEGARVSASVIINLRSVLCCLPSRTHLIQIRRDLCQLYAQINSEPADQGSCEMRIILPLFHSFVCSFYLHFNPVNVYPCLMLGRFIKISKALSFFRTGAQDGKSSYEGLFLSMFLCSKHRANPDETSRSWSIKSLSSPSAPADN